MLGLQAAASGRPRGLLSTYRCRTAGWNMFPSSADAATILDRCVPLPGTTSQNRRAAGRRTVRAGGRTPKFCGMPLRLHTVTHGAIRDIGPPTGAGRDPVTDRRAPARHAKNAALSVVGATSVGRATIFRRIYRQNRWGSAESASGVGSHLDQTTLVRRQLPELLSKYQITSMLDAPCGDLFWLSRVEGLNLDRYIGIDIVPDLINRLKATPPIPNAEFHRLDVISQDLPKADLVMCRDLLVHLSRPQIYKCLRNFRRSGATYLLVTTFPQQVNADIVNSRWRPINLTAPPYDFPVPLATIVEGSTQRNKALGLDFKDKELALWRLADLPL